MSTITVKKVVFEDEIVLYWERKRALLKGARYVVFLDGKLIGSTQKTHYEIENLTPNTKYKISVERIDEDDKLLATLFQGTIQTKKAKKRLDVTKAPYFAVGDGKTMNTYSIQKALNDCKRGECVYFPKGTYLTGALSVNSDTEIYLSKDAVLKGSSNIEDYQPQIHTRFEGTELFGYRALLNVGEMNRAPIYNVKNVIIRGGGKISGGGEALCFSAVLSQPNDLSPKDILDAEGLDICTFAKKYQNKIRDFGRNRPRLVGVYNAQKIIFGNITFEYGSSWTVHILYSKNVLTYGCSFFTKGIWNGDGWDPDSSENCTIFGCRFDTHDDAIAIKSGRNLEGCTIARPTKNVKIFDCIGRIGIAIGSELSGGILDISVWDCSFTGGRAGFRIKTSKKRGGFVKNVKVRDCIFSDIHIWAGYPINDDGAGVNTLTEIENVSFENVESRGGHALPLEVEQSFKERCCIFVQGFEDDITRVHNIQFKNIKVYPLQDKALEPVHVQNVSEFSLENVSFIDEGRG